MLVRNSIAAAIMAVVPFCLGFAVSDDFWISERGNDILNTISTSDVLDAFEAINHPDAMPIQTWQDQAGTTYQELLSFDQEEWDAMYDTLLREKTGVNSSDVLKRRQTTDQPLFFCTGESKNPYAYTQALKSVVGTVCGLFTYGVGKTAKIQIIKRYDLQDVGGRPVKVIFKYG